MIGLLGVSDGLNRATEWIAAPAPIDEGPLRRETIEMLALTEYSDLKAEKAMSLYYNIRADGTPSNH